MGIVDVAIYDAFPDLFDGFIVDEKRTEKSLARHNRISEAILDFDIQTSRVKDAVDLVFQLGAIYIEELISRDDFDIGQKEWRFHPHIRDTALDSTDNYTDLVEQITVVGNNRQCRVAR